MRTTAAAFAGLAARRSLAAPVASPYGALRPRTADNANEVLLQLPPDFRYTIVSRAQGTLDDGNPAPPLPDGMAAFDVNGELRLVRNHEIRAALPLAMAPGPWSYDPMGGGGTTTVVVDPITRLPRRQFVSLSGTSANCAGGRTPWNSWITCEETLNGVGAGFTKAHGYCFEVPAAANAVVPAIPLPHLGRFAHEAAAGDPMTSIVYLTEDDDRAGLYRCVPNRAGDLLSGGRLQMLAVRDVAFFDGSHGQTAGARLPVTWIDIADPNNAVFDQGRANGGARFRRLEGATFSGSSVFFTSTTGGDRGLGQVWELRVRASSPHKRRASGGAGTPFQPELTLLFESTAPDISHLSDNITVTPRGALMLCEDNSSANFLRVLTRNGDIFPFAQNITPGYTASELAGATFSPEGATLFVNVQAPGLTLAIWGPWSRGPI